MTYHEPPDIRTGKAPKHQDASIKKSSTSKQDLFRISDSYNPFFIEINGKTHLVNEIIIYNKTDEVLKTRWFGSNNNLKTFTIPEALRRLKPKYDGKTFVIPRKKEYHERNDPYPRINLYIPYSYFGFQKKEKLVKWPSGKTMHYDSHISTKFDQNYQGTPLTIDIHKGVSISDEAKKVQKEIDGLEKKLEEARERLKKL